jgi:hypothetical protein
MSAIKTVDDAIMQFDIENVESSVEQTWNAAIVSVVEKFTSDNSVRDAIVLAEKYRVSFPLENSAYNVMDSFIKWLQAQQHP